MVATKAMSHMPPPQVTHTHTHTHTYTHTHTHLHAGADICTSIGYSLPIYDREMITVVIMGVYSSIRVDM